MNPRPLIAAVITLAIGVVVGSQLVPARERGAPPAANATRAAEESRAVAPAGVPPDYRLEPGPSATRPSTPAMDVLLSPGPEPTSTDSTAPASRDSNGDDLLRLPLGPLFPYDEAWARAASRYRSAHAMLCRANALITGGRDAFIARTLRQRSEALRRAMGEDAWAAKQFQLEDLVRRHAEERFQLLVVHVDAVQRMATARDVTGADDLWVSTLDALTRNRSGERAELITLVIRGLPKRDQGKVSDWNWLPPDGIVVADN